MSYILPEIFECDFWRVETRDGTYFVPQDVCSEGTAEALSPYVEGEIGDITSEHGWLARLSAAGYCDCTDWFSAETKEEAKA